MSAEKSGDTRKTHVPLVASLGLVVACLLSCMAFVHLELKIQWLQKQQLVMATRMSTLEGACVAKNDDQDNHLARNKLRRPKRFSHTEPKPVIAIQLEKSSNASVTSSMKNSSGPIGVTNEEENNHVNLTGYVTKAMYRKVIASLQEELKDALVSIRAESERVCSTPEGKKCVQGPQGLRGPRGYSGDRGPQGIPGDMGPRGAKGDKGDRGEPGETGSGGPTQGNGAPRVLVTPTILTVTENSSASFYCASYGKPKPSITWRRNGRVLVGQRYLYRSNGELVIRDVSYEDRGEYECTARNHVASAEGVVRLIVRSPPRMKPIFAGPIFIKERRLARLPKCEATGFPTPVLKWLKVYGTLPQGRAFVRDDSLLISSTRKADSGMYICRASNDLGVTEVFTQLVVAALPEFDIRPQDNTTLYTGDIFRANCSGVGDPTLRVTWKKIDGKLPRFRATVRDWGELVITQVTSEDSGRYACLLSTDGGIFKNEAFTTLNVINRGTKGGVCPVPLPLPSCSPKKDECVYDVDCEGGMKCCSDSCHKLCVLPPPNRDCADLYMAGHRKSGVYTIAPDDLGSFDVYCDMETSGGGWTVIQRRIDGQVSFYHDWNDYKTGFGDLKTEFWLGNNKIHRLVTTTSTSLRVELSDWKNITVYAYYGRFRIEDEANKYRLSVGAYRGTAGDSLRYHDNMSFSTKDRDNDRWAGYACAVDLTGGWWYNNCHASNLNGMYYGNIKDYGGVGWAGFRHNLSLKSAEMKIRPDSFGEGGE